MDAVDDNGNPVELLAELIPTVGLTPEFEETGPLAELTGGVWLTLEDKGGVGFGPLDIVVVVVSIPKGPVTVLVTTTGGACEDGGCLHVVTSSVKLNDRCSNMAMHHVVGRRVLDPRCALSWSYVPTHVGSAGSTETRSCGACLRRQRQQRRWESGLGRGGCHGRRRHERAESSGRSDTVQPMCRPVDHRVVVRAVVRICGSRANE
jgi:hypothetical protein